MENSNQKKLLVALYARVSTGRQEQEETIESQIAEISARIASDGHILPPENIFIDDGWTGEMLARPSLDFMRDAAAEGRFQILYVYDRGRISRNYVYQEIIIEEITNREIEFVTLHDIKAQTPEEKVMQAMQGVFHEYERVKIVERMRRGKLYKAKSGKIINGQALYGYRYIKKTDNSSARIDINEEEARIVNMIFDWVGNERISMHKVVKRLFDFKISPKKGRSLFWTKGPIVRMLRCKTYVDGTAYYNKSEAVMSKKILKNGYRKVKKNSRKMRPEEDWIPFKVPVIINDIALFNRVQEILDYNKKYAPKNRVYDYLLSGKTWCECGNRRTGDGYKNNHYYRCAERIHKYPAASQCKSDGINAPALDAALWERLTMHFKNPELLKKNAGKWMRAKLTNQENNQLKARLENLISKALEEEKKYARAYGEGLVEFSNFQELMNDVKKRKLELKEQLEKLQKQTARNGVKIDIDSLCKEAVKVLETLDFSNKKLIVNDIIDKVIIKGRKEVEVECAIPLPSLKMAYEPENRDCGVA